MLVGTRGVQLALRLVPDELAKFQAFKSSGVVPTGGAQEESVSLNSREAGKLAIAGLAAAALLGSAASSASAAKLTLNYSCKYPLIGVQPLKVDIDAAIPTTWEAGKTTPQFVINAVASAGGSTAGAIQLLGAQTLEGTARAGATLKSPSGSPTDVAVNMSVANWTKSGSTVPNPLVLNAQGYTPALTLDDVGTHSITVDSIALNLTARDASGQAIPLQPVTTDLDGKPVTPSDSDPGTFDVPCKLSPTSQSTKLGGVTVNNTPITSSDTTAPSAPTNVKASSTATSTTLSWNASSDNVGVTRYEVRRGGSRVAVVNKTSVSLAGLAPSTTSSYTVTAIDAADNVSPEGSVSATTPANAVNNAAVANYSASLTGSATLKTLITGSLPLNGGINAVLKTIDGSISADLALNPSTGKLQALGFLPVTARVGFVPSGKTTGSLDTAGLLTTTTRLRIKLLDVKLFGAISIAGGNNCQTKSLSNIVLKSKPNFDPVAGGPISGTFAISDLNDCGLLTGIVSPLTAGGGNTINANLKLKG